MTSLPTNTQQVVVVGASGFGRECLDVLEAIIASGAKLHLSGVVDDNPSLDNLNRLQARKVPYLGTSTHFIKTFSTDFKFVLGIGDPSIRRKMVTKFESNGFETLTTVHPTAIIGSNVTLLEGVVICAGAIVATNVHLGNHVHINANATIGHDSILEDFVSINPASVVSGEVQIGESSLIGANSTILQNLRIGSDSLIAAMCCVTKDVPAGVLAKGIPARFFQLRS